MQNSWPYYFYEGQLELMTLQDFTNEQKQKKTNFPRLFGLFLLAINWIMTFTQCPLYYGVFLVVPYTNQTLIFTTCSLLYSNWASQNPDKFSDKAFRQDKETYLKHQARHHILYQLSFISNFVVFVVYWTLLHEEVQTRIKSSGKYGRGFEIHMYLIHIFPSIACLLNCVSTNVILRASFWKAIAIVGLFYFSLLGAFTMTTGIVLYGFANFEDWNTAFYSVLIIAITCLCNYFFCLLDWQMKPKLRSYNYDYYHKKTDMLFGLSYDEKSYQNSGRHKQHKVPKDLKDRVDKLRENLAMEEIKKIK